MKESQHVEWKESWRDEFLKWICGFANAFFRAGYIESWGRGIEKIRRECLDHDIKLPTYDFGMSGLMLTFHANPIHLAKASPNIADGGRLDEKLVDRLGEKLDEKLNKNRAAIFRLIKENPAITIRELAEALQISRTAVDNNIQALKSMGYIRRIGRAKGGNWETTEEKALVTTPGKTREKTPLITREKTREKILHLIRENPKIAMAELAEQIGITDKGIEWQIQKLMKEGLLARVGPDKGGYWEILK